MMRQQTVVKPRRIGRGGAVRWVVLGAAALFGVLLLAGCNVATAQDPSADELAQQRQENSDLQKQIEELEDEQDERNEADLQRQIDELEEQQDKAGAGHVGSQGSRQQAGCTRRWPQRGRRRKGRRRVLRQLRRWRLGRHLRAVVVQLHVLLHA